MQWGAEPLAQLELNAPMDTLRLDIKVHTKDQNREDDRDPAHNPNQETAESFHRGKTTQRAVEEKTKPA
jgi:hypothetical protein